MEAARIASYLVAKTAKLGAGRGGIPDVTWSDVAAACAGDRARLGYNVLMARYAGHGYSRLVAAGILEAILDRHLQESGRRMARNRRRDLALLAVDVVCSRVHCRDCGGTGQVKREGEHQSCPRCRGRGTTEIRDADKARRIGITRQSWQGYRPMMDWLVASLDIAEYETAMIARERLR